MQLHSSAMDIKRIIFIFVIFASVYGCMTIRNYGESVFLNLQSVSNRMISVIMFGEDEILIEQIEAYEEEINEECSALQQIGYRRVMGDPVSDELKYEAALSLDGCNEVVDQADQFLKRNGL